MDKINLALSIIGNELKAVVFRKGIPAARWDAPATWDDAEQFATVLREIITKTQPEGKEVSLVLAHPRLSNQLLEIPPAKGGTLERLLDRQAQTIKAFQGAAVWSRQPALPTKKSNAVLLHLLPKATLNQLLKGSENAHLQLSRVLPATAVLIGQLKALPLEKDEIALLAAETGGSTTLVIGRKDGRVVLGRVLAGSWATAPDRVWVDLTRSMGFAEQQSGVAVNSVWLFGVGAEAQVPGAQAVLKQPVRVSPVEYTPYYWAEQAVRLPAKEDGNLVSLEERLAPQRAKMLTLTGVILLIMVALTLGAAGFIEVLRAAEVRSVQGINRLMTKLQDQKGVWQKKYGEAAQKKELVRLVSEEKVPPVPAWFLGAFGEVVPDDIVLSSLRVQRTNDAWSVSIAGAIQPPTNQSAVFIPAQSLNALSNSLVSGPFHLRLTTNVLGSGAGRAGTSLAMAGANATNRFSMEGRIQ